MALLDVDFYSYYLGQDVSMSVLLDERRGKAPVPDASSHKVLYLLHGHSDDHTAFIRKSDIEPLTRGLDLIVVMPQAHRGFYTNPVYGYQYEDFLVKELPVVVGNFFHASGRREDNFIAGISMGGYGALRLALKYPELYSKAASLSGASDPYYAQRLCPGLFTVGDFARNIDNVFGGEEAFNMSDNSIEVLSRKVKDAPELYISCGTEDALIGVHERIKGYLDKAGIGYTSYEGTGTHSWKFWNEELGKVLAFLGLRKDGQKGF